MAYPTTLDTFPNAGALASGTLESTDHADLHGDIGDVLEALQAKVGVDDSLVTTSLDYLVAAEPAARDAAIAAAVAGLLNSAPGALDTLDELAAALGDDPNFATTVTNALATKQPLDATLTALAAYSATGLVVGNGSDGFTGRTLTAGSAKLTVTNGTGVAGNPTVDLGTVASTDLSNSSAIGLHTDKLSAFAATSSSELIGVISDETGSGSLVFGTSPTLATPLIAQTYGGTADTATLTFSATSHGTPATGSDIIFTTGTTQLLRLRKSGWTYHGPAGAGFPQYEAQAPGIEFNNSGAGAVYSSDSGLGASFVGTETHSSGATVNMRRSRGTLTSPTALQSGDVIGGLRVGSIGATYATDCGQIYWKTTEIHSASATGNKMEFYVTPNTTNTKTLALTLGQDQSATVVGAAIVQAGGTATYTASPPALLQLGPSITYTLNFASATMGGAVNYNPTVELQQTGNAFGIDTVFANNAVYKNRSANAVNLKAVLSFADLSSIRADTQTITVGQSMSFYSAPTYDVTNSGVQSAGIHRSFQSELTVGTGATVASRTGFLYNAATVSGTLTTQIGIEIANATNATTNIGIRNAGSTVYTPKVVTITAVGNAIGSGQTTGTVIRLDNTSGSSKTLTSAPTLSDGNDGQIVTVFNSSANDVVLQDQGTLPSSNLRLVTSTITLSTRDSVQLMFSSTVGDWIQISPVTNVI